jgi:single-stranded-DNA-specific exonuclease
MNLSVLHNIWEMKEAPENEIMLLSQKKDVDATIAKLLTIRDINVDNFDDFINPCFKNQMPDPHILKDCEKAVKIIADSIENNEKITIYGDYDVDGGTSTAVFVKFLREINASVNFYIPNKLTEGYGPNTPAFKKLKDSGTDLLITVDCGVSAFEPIEKAEFKTIIIDHHMTEEVFPKAMAVVNPKRLDDDSGLDGIAGVGVAFLVCIALNRELEKRGFYTEIKKPNLMSLVDLVALGTVCDVMKLTDINRVFVAQGLKVLNKKTNCGLRALCDVLEINKKIETFHLGYVFGPRINAGGRLGAPLLATELLVCEDYDEALKIAAELNDLNETRKGIESRICEEALEALQKDVEDGELKTNNAFVYNPDWHTGVSGIVASRLKEKFNKPAFVVSCEDGVAHGSARSVKGVDLGAIVVLAKQHGVLKDGGGHKMAAGFSCEVEKLDEFKAFLAEQIDKQTNGKEIIKTLKIDSVTSIKGANLDFLKSLELIAPFGNGNPKPKFCINDINISKTIVLTGKHIKCFLSSPYSKGSLEAIIFNAIGTKLGDFLLAKHDKPISLVGALDKNSWNGRESVQFMIEDAK